MNLKRIRELSGLEEAVDLPDNIPEDVVVTPPPSPLPATSDEKVDLDYNQIIVVKDVDPNSKIPADQLKVDDLITIVSPEELIDLLKTCEPNCNYTVFSSNDRAGAEAEAEKRLKDASTVDQFTDQHLAPAELEDEVFSKDEMLNPVVKESIEVEVSPDFIPAKFKEQKKDDCCELPADLKARIKNINKDLQDRFDYHTSQYQHNYLSDNLDDAGTDLKMMEVLTKLKHLLNNGEVSQATTYFMSLMSDYQHKVPATVRKFLHYGGEESSKLSNFYKPVDLGGAQ